MTDLSRDTVIESRSTCSIDEAVAKLLGWLKGAVRNRYCIVTEDGTPLGEMEYRHSLDFNLDEELAEQERSAKRALEQALLTFGKLAEASSGYEDAYQLCLKKENSLKDVRELIQRAAYFRAQIEDELAKGGSSALRLDVHTDEEQDAIQITLASLDSWARQRYAIEILIDALPTSPQSPTNKQALVENRKQKQRQQEEAVLTAIAKLGFDPNALPKFPPGKPGVRKMVRQNLNGHPLFEGRTVFDKAWERLSQHKDISYRP